jgi:uncharacterized membrane protein SpoIIM required for sporulation/ABC-type transport system involved in multi-copper enzyme maturation permease subunit
MISLKNRDIFGLKDLRISLIITRREVRDAFRDWRIIIPIVVLTLGFPILASFTARFLINFAERYGAELVGERLIPFLLLVIGFFPMSFSLVIALETFVGEKERKSLEPLLATPLTNTQLYVGKMLAAIVPPMSTSFLGIIVYVIGLAFITRWLVPFPVLVQILLLTTIQGVIMVAAAVIVSGQTTTVRAANLLASFIIVPMALLLQFESIVLFWGNSRGLWWLIVALGMTAAVLVRMGIKIFNREALLGQDIDQIRLGWMWQVYWNRLTGRNTRRRYPAVHKWFKSLFSFIPELRHPSGILVISLIGGLFLGVILARQYPVPEQLSVQVTADDIAANMANVQDQLGQLPRTIFWQNFRVIAIAALLGIFTLGVTDILIFMLPWTLIGYLCALIAANGENPLLFFVAAVLPHAVFELPALLLAGAAALRWHATALSPPPERSVGESWLLSAADFVRVMVALVVPLLILAAFVEAYVTPAVVIWVYGR